MGLTYPEIAHYFGSTGSVTSNIVRSRAYLAKNPELLKAMEEQHFMKKLSEKYMGKK